MLEGTCPDGLRIEPIKASGKISQLQQQEFDDILNNAQKRIIKVTINDLAEQQLEVGKLCGENKDKIEHSLNTKPLSTSTTSRMESNS